MKKTPIKFFKSNKKSRAFQVLLGIVVFVFLVSLFIYFDKPQDTEAAWWNSSWSYRKVLTVDSTKVIANLTDYPMLVSITDTDLATYAQEDADDIVFTDSNDIKLSHEIESYGSSTGELIAWVKIPSLSSSTDTQLFIYYGNNSASNQEDAANVWNSSYSAVWHMTGSSNGGENDSTSNGNNLSNSGSVGASNEQIIGPSREINTNGNNFLYITDNSTLDNSEELTIQAWARDTQGDSSPRGLVSKRTNSTTDLSYSAYLYSGRYYWFDVGAIDGGTVGMDQLSTNSSTATQNDWQLLHFVMDGSENDAFAYIDGSLVNSDSNFNLSTINDRSSVLHIGILNNGYSYSWLGQFDEVRIIKDALSSGWIETEHNNQSSPDTFVSFSSQVSYVDFLGIDEFWPVGHWSFDEGYGSTAHNESILGGDGVINGAAWKSEEECIAGKCLFFDGVDDYIDIAQVVDDYPVTMSAWVKANKNDSIGTPLFIGPEFENDGIAILFDDDANIYMTANGTTVNGTPYEENKWYYVSVVYTSSTERSLYVDGSLVSTEIADRTPSSFENVWIGRRYNWGVYDYFSGYIDEVKIYNYARTADQIKQDYNAGLAGQSTAKGTSASFGSVSEKWMSDGLLGYWKFDETATTSGAMDSSGNGNHGTFIETASTTVGRFGRSFIGDHDSDYVDLGDIEAMDSLSAITVSIWVKFNSNRVIDQYLVSKRTGGRDSWRLNRLNHGFEWTIDTGSNVVETIAPVSEGIDNGVWYHVVGTYDGSKQILYIDGEKKVVDNNSGVMGNVAESVLVGAEPDIPVEDFSDASIDEVRIYNRALSPGEVQKLYEWAPGPVAHWKMDELSGTTVFDVSGNENNLIFAYGVVPTDDTTWTTFSKYGSALEFDGVDDSLGIAEANLSDDFPGKNGGATAYTMTIEAWVYPRGNRQDYACKYGGSFCFWQDSSNFLTLTTPGSDPKGASAIELNKWSHVAVTLDGSFARFYINGILDDIDAFTEGIPASASEFHIGTSGGADDVDGFMDDVRIYTYARSQKQILEDMYNSDPLKGAVLDLSFDEGRGAMAHDASMHGNNGSLQPGTGGANTASSTMWSLAGVKGGAIELDGVDDTVTITSTESLKRALDYDFSLSGWFKTSTGGGIYNTYHGNGWGFVLVDMIKSGVNMGKVHFLVASDASWDDYYTEERYDDNQWHHFVLIRDSMNSLDKLYIDSEIKVTAPGSSNEFITFQTVPVTIGDSWAGKFAGLVDEIKTYPFALNTDEISKLYNHGQSTLIGSDTSRENNGTVVNGRSKKYCIPGDTAVCDPPVLEYKMDELSGDTVYDASGSGNDGSIYGATWDSLGKKGSALTFNGTDNDIRDIPNVDIQGNFTISAWIKPQTLTGERNIYYSLGDFFVEQRDDALAWRRVGSGCLVDGVGVDTSLIDSPSVLSIDKWQYATFVSDASNNKIYIYYNGRKVLDEDGKSDCPNSGFGARVGSTLSRYFDGSIDDFVIYDYARTPTQIAWDYDRGKPIAHWSFDECSGSTIHDESGNANHGTLYLGTNGVTATGTCAESGSGFWYNGKDGKINSGGSFDGVSDRVDISDIDGNKFFTVSAWVYRSSDDDDSGYVSMVSKYSPGYGVEDEWFMGSAYGKYSYWVRTSDGTNIGMEPDSNFSKQAWTHLVMTYDGNTFKGYANGEMVASETKVDIANNGTLPVTIGSNPGGGEEFSGKIDEVKIWNYALTSEQVKSEYNGGAVRFE